MSFASKLFRKVYCDDEEISCPKAALQEECREQAALAPLRAALDACTARVEDGAHESCVEEFFKLQKQVDACVSAKLFSKLK
ncbi:ubiquinol-cytochrome C reductase hinge protein-domain-containing protein [Blastocladiella britannica]|nr:ubiquinol-cytochrome C reductase hinge protein-domain-containing protein [Blastocladiella britannica]